LVQQFNPLLLHPGTFPGSLGQGVGASSPSEAAPLPFCRDALGAMRVRI
jgi:hypothetical protein